MSVRDRLARAGRTIKAAAARAATARPRWRRMRVLEWNVKVGRSFAREVRPQLDAWIAEHRPHAVVLIECYTILGALADYYGPRGWTVIYDRSGHDEARDVVLLIRSRRDPVALTPIRHGLRWTGPVHDRPRVGRVFPGARLTFAAWPIALYGIHRVPDPSTNSAAFAGEGDVIRRAVAQVPDGVILRLPGDHNAGGQRLADAARALGCQVAPGHGVDAELYRAPAAARMTVTGQALGKGESDHSAVLFTARLRRRKASR